MSFSTIYRERANKMHTEFGQSFLIEDLKQEKLAHAVDRSNYIELEKAPYISFASLLSRIHTLVSSLLIEEGNYEVLIMWSTRKVDF